MATRIDLPPLLGIVLLPAVTFALAYSPIVTHLSKSLIFLEARTVAVDPPGQRLGDRLSHTQVAEGAGARDLVKSFQDWLMSLGKGLGQAMGGRRRVPGRIDRAA
jgi:hypothetical protein